MRVCRFNANRLGVVKGDTVVDVTDVIEGKLGAHWPFPAGDAFFARFDELLPQLAAAVPGGQVLPLSEVKLLSPVANPGKIVAAPVNYRKHLDEVLTDGNLHHGIKVLSIQEVGLFLKAPSSLIGVSEPVRVTWPERRTDHEIELVVVIGKPGRNITAANAMQHVAGFTMGLDMTVRGPEERSYRKSIDTYTVLGPWLVTPDEIADPNALDFDLRVNGEMRQKANTCDLIFNVQELIEYASKAYTLHPGDVIMTGTPEGVAPVQAGDEIVATMDCIGEIKVQVA